MTATNAPTLPTVELPELPARFTVKDADTTAAAAAKVWLAAKCIEDAAKDAKSDRNAAESVLAATLTDGETVTLNGNATYRFGVSNRNRANDAAILRDIVARFPDVAADVARMREDARYRTPFTVYSLKPVGR
jgi:hypothetical protein